MFTSTGINFSDVKRFLEEERFVKVTDFAASLKHRKKNGKKRK